MNPVSPSAVRCSKADSRSAADLRLNAALTSASDNLECPGHRLSRTSSTRAPRAVNSAWNGKPPRDSASLAGLEHTRQSLSSDTVYNRSARTLDSARLGYAADVGSHQLQLNLRQDRYSDFGSADTWLAGYGYRVTDAWRLSATASTGFNAPTFNDLYYPFGGNAALRPERLKSAELGVQYAVEGQEVRATLFDNRFTDLFGFDSSFNRINIGRARIQGLELAYTGRIADTGVDAGFTRQDPVNEDTGARLPRRAADVGAPGPLP